MNCTCMDKFMDVLFEEGSLTFWNTSYEMIIHNLVFQLTDDRRRSMGKHQKIAQRYLCQKVFAGA